MEFTAQTALYASRRSTVYGRYGMVASSQPLASEIGLRILRAGGNAADAAIAVAAALNVTEPCSTGIGGDCFALFYDAETRSVQGMNGSGRSPAALGRDRALADCPGAAGTGRLPPFHAHTVTVPGAAAGWEDTLHRWGTQTLGQVLAPAIELAEDGFPVSPITAYHWDKGVAQLRASPSGRELLVGGTRAPRPGEVFRNPGLARTFRRLAEEGKDGFYKGPIADSIVQAVQAQGGVLTAEDLAAHRTRWPEPISVQYGGVDVYEIPPNGQGLTALIALNILKCLEPSKCAPNSAPYWHRVIEALRLAFADSQRFVADPDVAPAPVAELLSSRYADQRSRAVDENVAAADVAAGRPLHSSDTVCFQVVDAEGNCCSFINSNYMGFGSGLVPQGWGFTLQNRGANFTLEEGHPNVLAGGKRPYHTIIPGMALRNGELYCGFSVMVRAAASRGRKARSVTGRPHTHTRSADPDGNQGGFMQPQGHVQVILNMVDRGMDPQAALDAPRICLEADGEGRVLIEEGVPEAEVARLRAMGHRVDMVRGDDRAVFGRGQIIARDPTSGVLAAGSDGRADGCAMGW